MSTSLEALVDGLTDKEVDVLLAFPLNYDNAESEKGDNATWNEVADLAKEAEMPVKSVRGVVASLVKKGLVEGGHEKANGESGELQVLTDLGIDAVYMLVAQENEEMDSVTFIPNVDPAALAELLDRPVIENGLEMNPEAGEAFEAPMEAEEAPADEPETEEAPKPTKEKATPRPKLVLVDLDGKPVESRRAPSPDTLTLVVSLVETFGGQTFTEEAAAEVGFDADTLKRTFKRIKSWFGREAVTHGKGGWSINLRVREAEVEAA